MPAVTAISRKPLGLFERARLWLSYQRYALLFFAIALVLVLAPVVWARWYFWLPAMLVGLKIAGAGVEIYRRFPKKIRATIAARRRIDRGTFVVEFVESYCGDPCFRVVAREILRNANVPAIERARIVREFSARQREKKDSIVFVDRTNGVQIRVDGAARTWTKPHQEG